MQKEAPDIVCLQETKAFSHQIPPELRVLPYQNICRHTGQRPWYAGTAILSKEHWHNHANTFEYSQKFDEDGRVTEVEYDDFTLINIYFPNGSPRADGTEMLQYKLDFYDELLSYINEKQQNWHNIIIVGDFNICHHEIDIARPKENENSIWFLPIERAKVTEFLHKGGMVDIFRHFHPDTINEYTRRSYRAGARPRNVWRRLDYVMTNKSFLPRIESFRHRQDIMGSDHCPVEIVLR